MSVFPLDKSEKDARKAEDVPQYRVLFQCQFSVSWRYVNTCRVPDTVDIKRWVDYQRIGENVRPNVASVRIFNRVSWKRKEPLWRVCDVRRDVVAVVTGRGFLVEVIEISLAGARLSVRMLEAEREQ